MIIVLRSKSLVQFVCPATTLRLSRTEFRDPIKSSKTLARGGFFFYRNRKELIGLRPADKKSGRFWLANGLGN